MLLARARLVDVGPFRDVTFPSCDDEGRPHLVVVIHGGGGVGKTALLSALATTRPGHAVVQAGMSEQGEPAHVESDWILSDDDPERPHPLRVVSPNVKSADDETSIMQRREQALFDRRAKSGGFMFLALSSERWFSRQPIALHAPLRTVARYDLRGSGSLDDSTRFDLGRETKQALAYAAITAALAHEHGGATADAQLLGAGMKRAVDTLVALAGLTYQGVDPRSLEPVFATPGGRLLTLDGLPTRARHLVAFSALTVRTLWAAYPGRDPRAAEGVVAIDEVDLHQDPAVQERLVPALRRALPRVQWLLTTTSPTVAASCKPQHVLALRRLPEDDHIELFVGDQALTH